MVGYSLAGRGQRDKTEVGPPPRLIFFDPHRTPSGTRTHPIFLARPNTWTGALPLKIRQLMPSCCIQKHTGCMTRMAETQDIEVYIVAA